MDCLDLLVQFLIMPLVNLSTSLGYKLAGWLLLTKVFARLQDLLNRVLFL